VDLVDEEDRVRALPPARQHRLEPLLEVAAVARAGQQRAQVERKISARRSGGGHLAAVDPPGEPLGERRLADARVAHEERVVLPAPAQDLDRAADLVLAADQRVEPPLLRQPVQREGEAGERRAFPPAVRLLLPLLLEPPRPRPLRRHALPPAETVREEAEQREPRQAVLLEEEDGEGVGLVPERGDHVQPRDLAPGCVASPSGSASTSSPR
jgi:hypothetical protein